jgi:hypothetical protein
MNDRQRIRLAEAIQTRTALLELERHHRGDIVSWPHDVPKPAT